VKNTGPVKVPKESEKPALQTDFVYMNTAEIDLKDAEYGRTPLSLAVENGYTDLVKLLIEADKVDIDSKYNNGRTPLSWGAENGHEAVIKLLLETDEVNVDRKDNYGKRAGGHGKAVVQE
jgi:ankyrin repeat protein